MINIFADYQEFKDFLESFYHKKKAIQDEKSNIKQLLIEFAGPPKSGKSTLIDSIKYQFSDYGIIPEVSIDSAVKKDKPLEYMLNSQAKTRERLIEARNRRKEEIIFIDCGAFSELALLETYKKNGDINKKEEWIYKNLMKQILFDFVYEDIVFYVSIPLKIEKERINKEVEIKSYQRLNKRKIINPEFIEKFNRTYEELYNNEPVIKEIMKKVKIVKLDGSKEVKHNLEIIVREIKRI
ncbi:MAG: hypothetical protein QXU20_04290 [Candidatus Woesearchaeota archaeon]